MGGVRVAAATFCLVLPGLVSADRRGEVVCGVPPDEAVGYTIEKSYGGWEWWGLRPRYPHRLHDTEREALDEHAPEAIYVCDIEVMDNFKTFPARFYRLDRPLLKSETNVRGEMTEGENDARRWILGGEPNERPPPPSSSGAARSQIEHTPECLGGIEWHDEHGILFLRITNTCSYEAFVRTCWGAWANARTPGVPFYMETLATCLDEFLDPGAEIFEQVDDGPHVVWRDGWKYHWKGCAARPNAAPKDHPCYFEP